MPERVQRVALVRHTVDPEALTALGARLCYAGGDVDRLLKLIEENKQKAIEDAVKAAEDALREKLSDEHQKEIENMTVAHEQAMTAERSRRLGWADIKRFFKGESNEKTREDDCSGME